MMTTVSKEKQCINCRAIFKDDQTAQCPVCGQLGRNITIKIDEEVKGVDSNIWEKKREFYEKNPVALAGVIGITIGAPFLGLFLVGWVGIIVGLALGALTYWIGPFAKTKVREIERGR